MWCVGTQPGLCGGAPILRLSFGLASFGDRVRTETSPNRAGRQTGGSKRGRRTSFLLPPCWADITSTSIQYQAHFSCCLPKLPSHHVPTYLPLFTDTYLKGPSRSRKASRRREGKRGKEKMGQEGKNVYRYLGTYLPHGWKCPSSAETVV